MIDADGLFVALCSIGAERGRIGPSSVPSELLTLRRLAGFRSPFSSVGELVEDSTY